MLFTRRSFIKASTTGLTLALGSKPIFGNILKKTTNYYGVHPFVDAHPDAVFIMKTSVDVKTNADAKLQVGLDFGRSVFVALDEASGGIPITNTVALKPNITCRYPDSTGYTTFGTMGIVTDPYFVEGIIQSIKELGVQSNKFFIRETNCPTHFEEDGYTGMAARTGTDIRDLSATVDNLNPSDVQWITVNGTWFKRIPFLAPVNSPKTFLLNIAKFKTHTMGMTLCAKNLQGTIAHNYQEHCAYYSESMSIPSDDVQSDAKAIILANYNRRLAEGIPRWDKPGDSGGLWMETWATRCLDNNSVTKPNLHIIEGIYGRDGNFIVGPSTDGLATDYMTNIIIFGKNPFHVDTIGHWLGGHEPGNFGLFHMALERGLSNILNPAKIPLYEWKSDGTASLATLDSFTRTPLKTKYLQRDYNGQNEDLWHLVNEPYDYPLEVINDNISKRPKSFVLHQNFPNPFNPATAIQFSIPGGDNVRIEICDITGSVIAVLANGYFEKGEHMVSWKGGGNSSGVYFYRMMYRGSVQTKKMIVLK